MLFQAVMQMCSSMQCSNICSDAISRNWNDSRTLKQNMNVLGIAFDSNEVVSEIADCQVSHCIGLFWFWISICMSGFSLP
jgi:hypothetical protein